MSKNIFKKEALDYHSSGRKGKIEVIPSNHIIHKEIFL